MKNTYKQIKGCIARDICIPEYPWKCFYIIFISSCMQGYLLGSHDREMSLWDTKTWQNVLSFTGHSDRVEAVQLKIYDATKLTGLVLSGCKDQTIKYWDITRCV